MPRDSNARRKMKTRRPHLKPFAKLASRVCSQWRTLIYWKSLRQQLWRTTVTLHFLHDGGMIHSPHIEEMDGFVLLLAKYLQCLRESEDTDLEISWSCALTAGDLSDLDSLNPNLPAVRLFLHGMNLTTKYLSRMSSLYLKAYQPEIVDFCFCLVDRLPSSRLTHLFMTGHETSGKPVSAPFAPSFSALSARRSGRRPVASLASLATLTIISGYISGYIYLTEGFALPTHLSHLSLEVDEQGPTPFEWKDFQALLLQSGSLLTLNVRSPPIIAMPKKVRAAEIVLPNLVELDLSYHHPDTLSSVLVSFNTPQLRLLRLRLSRDSEGEIETLLVHHYPAPPQLHLVFSQPQMALRVLDGMLLDNIRSLHLTFHGFSEMTEMGEDAALYFPSLTELSLGLTSGSVSWLPFVQNFRIPYLAKLNYIVDVPYHKRAAWREFAKRMPEFARPLVELTLPIPDWDVGDDIDRHPFHHATMVEALTLTDINKLYVAELEWLEWPQVGKHNPTFSNLRSSTRIIKPQATMPHLRSLGITLSKPISQPHDWELFEYCGRRLHSVVTSRLDAGVPLENIFIKDDEGQLIWSTDCPTMIQDELQASKSNIETALELRFDY